jgi:hypothetical protein
MLSTARTRSCACAKSLELVLRQCIRLSALFGSLALSVGTANAADILVGPTRAAKTLASGVALAQAGDRIILDAGTYVDNTASIVIPLTIEGAGAGATLSITKPISNGKGILVVDANVTVRNITFQGAQVADRNGAGIRFQAGSLTVDNCTFVNNQNGILANRNIPGTLTINGSRFTGNGYGDGYTHGIYIGEIGQLTVTGSTFSAQKAGHNIKSRALRTTVIQTILDDGVTGSSAYAIDISNGGVAVIDGVTVTQGTKTTNPAMIAYGAEGSLKATNSLTVRNSSFTNQLSSPSSSAVYNFTTSVNAAVTNGVFTNVALPLRGPGTVTTTSSAAATLRQASVFSTAQADAVSYLRFYNTGTAAGTVTVDLYNGATGAKVAQWQSPSIAANATLQVPVSTIEAAGGGVATKPQFYAVGVAAGFTGTFQHIVHRPSPGSFVNLSNCDTGLTTNAGKLANVHSSLLDGAYPSTILFYNSATTAAAVTVGVFDARNGTKLGTFTTPSIAPGTQAGFAMAAIETGARITPSTAIKEYTVKVESAFTGTVQHIIDNQAADVLSDMTAACPLK